MKYWDYLLIFLIALAFFTWLHSDATFADPDSFYHAKISLLMAENGIIRDFVWLPFTVLRTNYVDHHFLYHIFLIPFVTFFSPLIGIKIATVFLAVLLLMVFYWLLKQFKVRYSWFYVLLLLPSVPFIFRIGLAKTSALSIIVLLFGFYLIVKKKHWALAVLSFFYVWLYGGFILMLVLAFIYALAGAIIKRFRLKFKEYLILLKPFFVSLIGVVLGLVINPYFPKNLYFYWVQVIEVAVVNYQQTVNVGMEWYAYPPLELIGAITFVSLIFLVGLTLFLVNNKKQTAKEWALFMLTLCFLALTVKSRRNVEYFVPLSVLFSALSINQIVKNVSLKRINLFLKRFLQKRKTIAVVLAIYLLLTFSYIAINGITEVKEHYVNGLAFTRYAESSQWIKENVPAKEIILHSDWDDFPMLFYYNSNNYYISGLDPTFMYKYSPRMYEQWAAITKGEQKEDLYDLIKKGFHSSYVIVGKDHPDFANNLNATAMVTRVFEGKDAWVYKLR